MQYETIIISVLAAVVVIGLLYWRSKREERAASSSSRLRTVEPAKDVLVSNEREDAHAEPVLVKSTGEIAAAVDAEAKGAKAPIEPKMPEPASIEPDEEPPVYKTLEAEKKQTAEEAARAKKRTEDESDESEDARGGNPSYPPVDPAVEWVLDISPKEGQQFTLGGVRSLAIEINRLGLPLLVRCWAQSVRDGRYYEAKDLASPAKHVVASLVLANRTAKLDDVKASAFYQVLEQSAAQSDVAVRRQLEPAQAVERSEKLKQFIEYFDTAIEVLLEPIDPEAPLTVEGVNRVARGAGFTAETGCWEYRVSAADRNPILRLAFGDEGTKSLVLAYDVPVGSLERGDLRLFFSMANHLANALRCAWVDQSHNAIDAGGALLIEEAVQKRIALMAESGAEAGSERAKLLFSRGA